MYWLWIDMRVSLFEIWEVQVERLKGRRCGTKVKGGGWVS